MSRVEKEFTRRGYACVSRFFRYFGFSLPRWDYAFLLGSPRHWARILRDGRPCVVTMGKPESPLFCQKLGLPYLPVHAEQEATMATIIGGAPRVVFISHYVRRIWEDIFAARALRFPKEDRIRVIPHGVDLELFSPISHLSEREFVLGSAGSFRQRFRIQTLFEVSRRLSFPHRLLLVGSLNAETKAELLIQLRQTHVDTTYVPWVPAEELPAYYRQMDCLFHPVDYEGCGIVVVEALACGVPVVVPAHGAPMEYVCPDGGLAVPTEQYTYDDAFCDRMADAVTTIRDRRGSFSSGARKQAVAKLSLSHTMDDYLEFMGVKSLSTG